MDTLIFLMCFLFGLSILLFIIWLCMIIFDYNDRRSKDELWFIMYPKCKNCPLYPVYDSESICTECSKKQRFQRDEAQYDAALRKLLEK